MGACLSVSPAAARPDLESTLQTGDIVLLLDGSKTSKYLVKAGSAGGWARASKVGFLVREPHSGELFIYQADETLATAPGMTRITGRSLTEELNNYNYRLAIVRRLRSPLSPEKTALVRDFVALNNGAIIPELQRPSSVLMASFSSPTQAFEHLDCSDFVMMMLHLVGLVEPTQNPFEYVASDARGRLLSSPVTIKIKSSSPSTSSTTTSSCQAHVSVVGDGRVSMSSSSSSSKKKKAGRNDESSGSPTSVVAGHSSLNSSLDEGSIASNRSAPTTPTKINHYRGEPITCQS